MRYSEKKEIESLFSYLDKHLSKDTKQALESLTQQQKLDLIQTTTNYVTKIKSKALILFTEIQANAKKEETNKEIDQFLKTLEEEYE